MSRSGRILYSVQANSEQVLTPRTPRSRAGRAEEAMYEVDGDENAQYANFYDSGEVQQRAPLLPSSTDSDASFPYRGIGSAKGEVLPRSRIRAILDTVGTRLPLLAGLLIAIFLAILLVLSVERPDTLDSYLHGAPTPISSPSAHNVSHSMAMLSYENYTSFPLAPIEYRQECSKFLSGMKGPMGTYWHIPPGGPMDVEHKPDDRICTSTITYMLDGYVGLAADLALIAQVAGLAREMNRTILVDDRDWNRGKWTNHFQDIRVMQPGPEPGCLPPPPEELVACPRTARHWVINSRTALFHFGHHFMDEFEDPYARELRRAKPIFQRAVASFAHSIRPNAENARLIQAARQEVRSSYLAVHIRHGDRKTEGWEFHGGYVPLGDYADAIQDTAQRVSQMAEEDKVSVGANSEPDRGLESRNVVWIATDDPNAREELVSRLTGPDGAKSISRVYSLDTSDNQELREIASREPYFQAEFCDLPLEERIRATRGALVDLALVGGLWDWEGDNEGRDGEARLEAVVCTISSNFCKLSALGLGWERAFGFAPGDPDKTIMNMDNERKRWVEIDLKGVVDPVWRAFEMF